MSLLNKETKDLVNSLCEKVPPSEDIPKIAKALFKLEKLINKAESEFKNSPELINYGDILNSFKDLNTSMKRATTGIKSDLKKGRKTL